MSRARADRALGGHVLLLRGDPLLVERQAEALRHSWIGADPPFGALETLQADALDASGLLTAVLTMTLAPKRLVMVRHADRLRDDAQRALLEALDDVPGRSAVLLLAGSVDGRRALFAELERRGRVESHECESAERLVAQLAHERRLDLSPEATATLATFLGSDAARVDAELEKLALLHGQAPIDVTTALGSVGGDRALAQFELANALRDRRIDLAIRALRDSLARGGRIHQVLGQVAHELRSLFRARALLASGLGDAEAIRAFGGWAGRFAVAGARRYRLPELRRAIAELLEVDVAVKTGRGDAEAKLERLLLGLAPPAGGRQPGAPPAGSPERNPRAEPGD